MRLRHASLLALLLLCAGAGAACAKSPDPWAPGTYPAELKPFVADTGALGREWKKCQVKGMEESSFFFVHDRLQAVITVTFTCGKYQDVELDQLAGHLLFPMGKKVEVLAGEYLDGPGVETYHAAARGEYQYHKETLYKKIGLVPAQSAPMVLDAYVIGTPHCVADVVYAAAPGDYAAGLNDFHAYLGSLGIPIGKSLAPDLGAAPGSGRRGEGT